MKSKSAAFWDWFEQNNVKYLNLDELSEINRDRLLDEFLEQLHMYSDKLFFLIGGETETKKELIITAEGNLAFFDKVEELVSTAPDLKNWLIIPFKPGQQGDFVTEHEDIKIDTKETWFLPLESKKEPNKLGLRILVPNFEEGKKEQFLFAAYQVLDAILGEKENALTIHYVEVDDLPSDPEKSGSIELCDLPAYIEWRRQKKM